MFTLQRRPRARLVVPAFLLMLAACATPPGAALKTLDGKPPMVAAHRGASGYLPGCAGN